MRSQRNAKSRRFPREAPTNWRASSPPSLLEGESWRCVGEDPPPLEKLDHTEIANNRPRLFQAPTEDAHGRILAAHQGRPVPTSAETLSQWVDRCLA
jgi:hypothetical protein